MPRLLLLTVIPLVLLLSSCPQPSADADTAAAATAQGLPAGPTLAEELDELHANSELPPETQQVFDADRADLESRDWSLARELKSAPMFTLKSTAGEDVVLGRRLARDKVVVVQFYRGRWCPTCTTQMRHLNTLYPELLEAGAELIAISPESPQQAAQFVEEHGLQFPVLSDPGSQVAARFGAAYPVKPEVLYELMGLGTDLKAHNETEEVMLPLAATFVFDKRGNVVWRYIGGDYHERAESREVLKQVQNAPRYNEAR